MGAREVAKRLRELVSARVAATKYHRLKDLKNRHLFSHSSGGRGVWDQGASMIDWVLVRASFWLAEDSFLLCPHMAQGEKERERQTETDK